MNSRVVLTVSAARSSNSRIPTLLTGIPLQALVALLSPSLFLMAAEATGPSRRGAEVQAAWVDMWVGDLDRSGGSTHVRNALEEMEGITGLAIRLDEPIISVRYDPSQTRPEKMLVSLAALGFRATLAERMDSLGGGATKGNTRDARPSKVYTNDDLPKRTGRDHVQDRATSSEADAAVVLRQFLEQQAELEQEWRPRFAQARMRLRQAEKNAWRIVTRIVLVGGGTGLGGTGRGVAIPVPMKVREFVETDELRGARQALEALEEEFRKAGLPPGWSRE